MYLKIRKVFATCFLYDIVAFFVHELCDVILLGSQIGSGRDPRKEQNGCLAELG
jgi:hypothetical protein